MRVACVSMCDRTGGLAYQKSFPPPNGLLLIPYVRWHKHSETIEHTRAKRAHIISSNVFVITCTNILKFLQRRLVVEFLLLEKLRNECLWGAKITQQLYSLRRCCGKWTLQRYITKEENKKGGRITKRLEAEYKLKKIKYRASQTRGQRWIAHEIIRCFGCC